MNELYKSFNASQYPFLIADFQLAKCWSTILTSSKLLIRYLISHLFCFILHIVSYDVNVSPDKRTIFIHNENKIIEALKVIIIFYE